MNSLSYLVDSSLIIEKLRVASEVRQTHLKLNGRSDPETNDLHQRIQDLEDYVDGRVAELIKSHPAYPWFSRVKGIGKENIGKVVGQIRVAPSKNEEDEELPYADTISALWKFCGYSVENGKAPKREKGGGKLSYNSNLRSMCWRLATCLLRAKGKFYEYYLNQKERYTIRFQNQGTQIVPANKLPKKDGKIYEPENMISEGHIHNMAQRKMVKLFLSLLWLEWRRAGGLPITTPYAIDQLKHDSFISPEEMTDR